MAEKKSGKKSKAILTVDLGDRGGTHSFRSLEAVRDWLQAERTWWEWLERLPRTRDRQAMGVWNHIGRNLTSMDSALSAAEADPNNDIRLTALRDSIQNSFTSARLIHSSSRMGKVVLAECEIDVAAGLAATAYYMGEEFAVTSPLAFRGSLSAALAELGLKGTAEAARKVLDELTSKIQSQFTDYKTEQEELLTASRGFNEAIKNQIASHDQLHTELIRAHNHDFSDLVKKSKEEWQNLTDTYDVALSLRAPVRYWSAKRRFHRKRVERWGKRFGLGLGVCTLILIPALLGILWGDTLRPGMIGVAAVLVTFALWGLSIIARNLLSHQHLATDADERVVMVLTYLALLREGKGLKEEQKQFILEPLFRSASTGIVKDDARPPSIVEKVFGKLKL